MRGTHAMNLPEAFGTQIISTNSTTSCRDDVAFVVIDRVLPGIVPMPMRLDGITRVGEPITLWGFGLTTGFDPTSLRVVNAQIDAVGPDTPPMTAQPAPVRSVRTGPVTCVGDSGGPFVGADGTLIAIVSLGTQAASNGPFCDTNAQPTVGPRLAAYRALALQALAAAGIATDAGADVDSTGEAGPMSDDDGAMPADDGGTPEEDASMEPDAGEVVPPPPEDPPVDDSGCSMGPAGRNGSQHWAFAAVALAVTAAARKRRRRHGSAS
jgi:MYXO-CTERM domain-containing protein